jgi:hypothetical protein
MARFVRLGAAIIFAVAVLGCATTMTVSSHVRSGLDIAPYRTYDWGPADAIPAGDARLDEDPVFQDQLQGAVEKQLAIQGITLVDDSGSPDLLIHYHANIDRRIDVNLTEREYGYCQDTDCESWVIEYEAGTLVLDVIDARTNQLLWRGWAQDSVADALGNEDRMAEKINEAVTRMMATFPRP